MNLVIIRENKNSTDSNGNDLLRFALSSEIVGNVFLSGLCTNLCLNGDANAVVAVPKNLSIEINTDIPKFISYTGKVPFGSELIRKSKRNQWLIVSNGRFATQIDSEMLHKTLADIHADIVAVNVEPGLLGGREKIRLTAQGKVAGFTRLYSDLAEPAPVPTDWPHHIFIKTDVLDRLVPDGNLPQSFSAFLKKCQSDALKLCAINIGGLALDLETEEGLLGFCQEKLSEIQNSRLRIHNSNVISPGSRLVGKVLLGKNVHIGQGAVIVGPSIIGNNVKVGDSAIINSSIIGPEVNVPKDRLVQNRIVKGPKYNWENLNQSASYNSTQIYPTKLVLSNQTHPEDSFRIWPTFSYAGCIKRIADIVAAAAVLILFAPVFPIIALVIKFTSRGPVFFKDTRQGLHGREFGCLKFRTMILGADLMQDKLRSLNEVDGDHYKMEDDPRISPVGRFLRDTHIDEIPQFLNVLLGKMSLVGPRPSPESENTQCPSWRDARLSVRPGITGLWQVCRTRQAFKDFQEWIYYDTRYVRDLSLKMDLWICCRTALKMLRNFVRQF
jgi:lipopolysaccharide/colanic/teichoic acid biosynthesis glycosyltransferase